MELLDISFSLETHCKKNYWDIEDSVNQESLGTSDRWKWELGSTAEKKGKDKNLLSFQTNFLQALRQRKFLKTWKIQEPRKGEVL